MTPDRSREEFEKWWSVSVVPNVPGRNDDIMRAVKDAFLAAWHRSRAAAVEECAVIPVSEFHKRMVTEKSTYDDRLMDFALDIEYEIRTLSQQEDGK